MDSAARNYDYEHFKHQTQVITHEVDLRKWRAASQSLIIMFVLVCLISGCTIGSSVIIRRQPGGPVVPIDSSILQTELNGTLDVATIGSNGSVWHVALIGKKRQLDHWLVLYPDGKFVTSLCDEREWEDIESSPGVAQKIGDGIYYDGFVRLFGGEEEVARQRAIKVSDEKIMLSRKVAENASRLAIIDSKDTALLMREIRAICKPVFTFPKIGRFAFCSGTLKLNVFELHPQLGVSLVNYDESGVSQLVFQPDSAGAWVLNEKESRTVWWSTFNIVDKVTNSDHLILHSTRGRQVVLRKVEGFAAPRLPEDWQW